jgi:Domain of unknown function (DUF4192)
MTESTTPRLTLRTPTDVVAAVPYLLGFHPDDSVVVVGMRNTRVVFNVRADLPAAGAPSDQLGHLADELATVLAGHEATRALIVGYGRSERVDPVVVAVRDALSRDRVGVVEMLRVSDGRYWSYLCDAPDCCPSEGTVYDANATEVAAAATYAGRVVLPDRTSLTRVVAPPAGAELAAIEHATELAAAELAAEFADGPVAGAARRRAAVRVFRTGVERHRTGGRLDDAELARFTLLLNRTDARDAVWKWIMADRSCLDPHVDLWRDVVRRARPDLAAPAAAMLGFTAWRAGDGALAWFAVQRALSEDPQYSLAQLVAEALMRALPPTALDRSDSYPSRTRCGAE